MKYNKSKINWKISILALSFIYTHKVNLIRSLVVVYCFFVDSKSRMMAGLLSWSSTLMRQGEYLELLLVSLSWLMELLPILMLLDLVFSLTALMLMSASIWLMTGWRVGRRWTCFHGISTEHTVNKVIDLGWINIITIILSSIFNGFSKSVFLALFRRKTVKFWHFDQLSKSWASEPTLPRRSLFRASGWLWDYVPKI